MRILLAGGGSGGHVTPLQAISDALKEQSDAPLSITVITDRGFYTTSKLIFAGDDTVRLKKIFCGKYRRYKSKSFLWHIYHLPTFLKNIRDVLLLGLGIVQSVIYFMFQKPDVVFCKGGFVCIPVGIAAKLFKVPLVIHDSDTRPGLTNRILAKWAIKIGTGMPSSFYPYPKRKMVYTGIPVQAEYTPITQSAQRDYKKSLGLPAEKPLLLVTGGGNGATSLNRLIIQAAPALIAKGWNIVLLAGLGKAADAKRARQDLAAEAQSCWQIEEFAAMHPRLLAADVIISRTSASTLQECANAKKAVIGIASRHLDDQKMNAEYFASKRAIISLDEADLEASKLQLIESIDSLYTTPHAAAGLADTLYTQFAKPAAAHELADLIRAAAISS